MLSLPRVGRNIELKGLFVDSRGFRNVTRKGIPIAITGLAGIGKTQLALAFAYRFNLFFPDGVYWVDVPNGIVHEFGKLGPHLGVVRLQDEHPNDYADRVLDKLRRLRNGLIIFDNVTNFSEFRQWCPEGNTSCSVILTTRLSPRGFSTRVVNLTELDADSAFELLIARRRDGKAISQDKAQRDALKELCRITGNHPLALELCASRLQSEFIKPSDYLKAIRSDLLRQLSGDEKDGVSLDAATASLMEALHHNYASLNEKLVDRYFFLMCCFAPHEINEELIVHAYDELEEGRRALYQLSNISFIRRELPNTLSLHPLVAQFGRDFQKHKGSDYSGKFIEVMLDFLRAHDNNLASEDVRREKPHLDEALSVAENNKLWEACATLHEYDAVVESGIQEQIDSLDKAYQIIEQHLPEQKRRLPGLRLRLGKAHRAAGRLREALADFSHAEVLYREVKNVDPAEAASLGFELGTTYLALGRYHEAEKTLSGTLEMGSAILDNSAPEILQLRQALAEHALYLGNYDAADAGFTEILSYRKKFYTAQPDAASAAGLASAHADLSRLAHARAHYAEAIQSVQDALAITKQYYNESDPECSHLFLLLGTIHYEAGDYSQAEEQLDKARRDFLIIFGESHPSHARALITLGEVHRKQGKFDIAKTEVERAIAIFGRVYGDSHPFVAEALEVEAKIYDHLCEFDEEQAIWERVLHIQRQFYAEQHPALAATHCNYANLCLRRSEYDKAAEHLQSSLRITEHNFGKTHACYFGCLVRLATCRYEQQEYLLAQGILDEAKMLQPQIFGYSPHPFVGRMLQLQSEILRRRGEFDRALKAIDDGIATKKALYGTEDHPSVAESLEVKVKIFHHLGERMQAKLLIDRTLEIRRKAYGENHPEVSRSFHDLGSYYLRLGQYAVAIEQFERARQITASVFGKVHPDYIERTLNLANSRNEQGEYRLALELLAAVEATLPAGQHYLTARWLQLMGELMRRIGRFGKALDYVEQAITMKKALYGSDIHPSAAEALEVQAKIYDHRCEFDKEQIVWERILEIQHKFYSEQHPVLANTHYDYSSLFLRKGEYEKAAEHVQLSLQITEHNFGKNHADYFGSLVRLAICRYEQQEYSLAQGILDEAKKLRRVIFGDSSHPYIARMLQLQSEILRRQGRFDEALEAIDQVIAMKKAIYGTEDHPSVADAMEVKVKIFHHRGERVEAKVLIERALEIRRKAYGEDHPEVSRSIHDLGSYYLRLGQYKDAAKHFEQARRITATVFGKGHPDYIERTLNLADARNAHGEYRLALELVAEVETSLPMGNHYLTARWLQLMGELQRRLGRFDIAMDYIVRAIAMKKVVYGTENHPSVAEALEVQAKIYDHLDELDKEQISWDRILEIQHRFYSEQHPTLATAHYNYASLFLRKGEYEKAAEHLQTSLRITEQNFGKTHAEYFGRLVRFATCRYEQQQYSLAQETLDQAKDLQNAIFGDSSHPYIARMLQLQSEILRRQGRFDEALGIIDQAIAMKEEIYGTEDHPSVADAMEVKAALVLDQYQISECNKILDTVESIRSNAYGKTHPEYANYQMLRAESHTKAGQYEKASEILEQSLETCLSIFSTEHPEAFSRKIELARIARFVNDIDGAESRINNVLETLGSRLETEDSLIVAETYQVLSYIRRAQGNYHAAQAELEKALRIKTKIFGSDSPTVIELQNERARSLIAFHRLTEANEVIEGALRSIESNQPLHRLLRSDLLGQRGLLQDLKREYDQAIKNLEEAIKLRTDLLGEEDVELARLYVEKAVILRHQSKYNEALIDLEAALNIDNLHFIDENHVNFARILLEQGQTYLDQRIVDVAEEHLKAALHIYDIQPNQNVKQHAEAAEALGRSYMETGFLHQASEMFRKAMEIKTAIYGNSHPEIAKTLHKQAQVLLKLAETAESQDAKAEARQKLEQALDILGQRDDNTELISDIESTLADL
jgi:tetratricopeptide (TPR) repeat protein